jgi:hypothetical protein
MTSGAGIRQLGSYERARLQTCRRIGASLRNRVARSSAVDLRAVLGDWFVVAAAVTYGAGLLVGGSSAVLADHARDRAVSVGFVVGLFACAGLGAAVLVQVARRPAIAEDDRSLIEDDTLRREDASAAIAPLPAMLAAIAGVGSTEDWQLVAYLGYAAAAALAWAAWWRAAVRMRRSSVAA